MPVLFLTVLIDLVGFGIVIPILPYLAHDLGATNFDIAMVLAVYSVFAALVGPSWGRLSDRIGRKPVLLICLGGAAVSYVMLAFSTTLAMLYLSRALAGLMAGNFGVASAIVADLSRPEERARSMGVIGSAFGLGMVVGPFLGGVLAGENHDFMLPGLVAAALSATAMLAGTLFLRESLTPALRSEHAGDRARHGDGGPLFRMLRGTRNTLLVGQFLLNNSCHTTVTYLFPLWVGVHLGWGAREVGMVFGAQGVAMAVLQAGLIGRLVRGLGELRVLVAGASAMAAGFALAAFAQGSGQILLAFFLTVTGGTLCTPVLNALTANRTPPHLRGRMLGTASSSGACGRVTGPLLAGALLSLFGYEIAWLGGALIALLIGIWALTQMRRKEHIAPLATAAAGGGSGRHGG